MKNILLAYASKAGSTAEIAQRIGKTLSGRGYTVDVKPVSQAGDLSGYQGIILGSAIRIGNVLPEVKTFIEKNQAALTRMPFNLFIVCMTLEKDTEENRKAVAAYLEPVRAIAKPAVEGMFSGVIDTKKLPFIERLMIKAMKAPVGDFRRWDQIEAWTETLALPA